MKRFFIAFTIFALATTSIFAEKSKLTIKNTFGSDTDSFSDYNLYTHSSETNASDEKLTANTFALGDRFQLDYESKILTLRFRLDTLYHASSGNTYSAQNDEIPSLVFAPSGFVYFTPIKQFGIIAGTSFYKQFKIPSGYLAASDDTTKYARLLTTSLSSEKYVGSEKVALYYEGYGGGLTSNLTFGNSGYLNLAAGSFFYTEIADSSAFEYSVDFGFNGGIKNVFDAGFTAHNISSANRKFGAFAGLTTNENLILNAGFYYNFTSSDYLPESRVNRNDVDEFKKQSTKYALGFTGGYDFEDIGLGLYADFITGLTNEYIGTKKYYDEDGNLIKTETTTIIRGGDCVKYKYNSSTNSYKLVRTDEFVHEAIPFYMQFRLDYDVTESLNLAFNFKLRSMWNNGSESWITIYPRASVDLPNSLGKIGFGLKFDMNLARYKGLSDFSIPLTYTYKFKKNFK